MTARNRRHAALAGPVLLAALLLAGCGGGGGGSSSTGSTTASTTATAPAAAAGCRVVSMPPLGARSEPKPTAPLPAGKVYEVTFVTNCGSFTFEIDQAQSPNAAASFVSLVQHGFFDKTVFHRIVPGFVIQGGDPTGSGAGGPGYTTHDRPPANAAYTRGVVAMAKTTTQPAGTAGSQFFVVTSQNAGLTPDYAIVGKVTSGLPVVERIGRLGDANEQPTAVVEIEKATVKVS